MASEWDKLKGLYHKNAIIYPFFKKVPIDFHGLVESLKDTVVEFKYCTVHEIRIIENIAMVMFNYESVVPSVPKRAIFIWMEQSDDWKLISQMSKEE